MQTRGVKELLELMLRYKKLFSTGICMWSTNMFRHNIINSDEVEVLTEYIDNNLPVGSFLDYCWPKKELQPRIDWIKEQITKLEKDGR